MIGKLKGLVDGFGDDYVHLDVDGVVYEAFCSAKTLQALPQVGHAAVVHIEMIVREDMIRLYGFCTEAEKAWFRTLMTVQGVGARVALAILSALTPSRARQRHRAAGQGHGRPRQRRRPQARRPHRHRTQGQGPAAPGIDAGVLGLQAALGEGVGRQHRGRRLALTNLGYSSAQASAAVARVVGREGDGVATDKLIRLGLRELSS